MNLLLKEYLSSGDCREADHCLHELEVPHFHHELVYEVSLAPCDQIHVCLCCQAGIVMLGKYLGESRALASVRSRLCHQFMLIGTV